MKRVKANDPAAIRQIGDKCFREGDFEGAFEYLTKAAELGDADAHACLGSLYYSGNDVEKDMKKYAYHSEEVGI